MIEEIEELMQDSPEMESEQIGPHSDLTFISQKSQRSHSSQIYEESEYVLLEAKFKAAESVSERVLSLSLSVQE